MPSLPEALAAARQHHQAGRLQAAELIYRQILQLDPNHADATHLLGVIAHQAGMHETASELVRRAIGLNPDAADFHSNLAKVYAALGRLPQAIASCQRALELEPNLVAAHLNLANAFKEQGELDEAAACFHRVTLLKPRSAAAHFDFGNACQDLGNLDEAIASFRRAVELRPDFAAGHNNLGGSLMLQGKHAEAASCFHRALELNPAYAEAHNNLAMHLLLHGRYREGWTEYEHRLRLPATPVRLSKPRWHGGRVDGCAILIHCEQGFGDALQFLRYAPLVRQRSGAGRIVVAAEPTLARLLKQNLGPDAEIAPCLTLHETSLPPFDFHVPLLSLPFALGQADPLPMTGAYIQANPELRQAWRERLGPASATRVGLAWAGSSTHTRDHSRSLTPENLLPLLQTPGFQFHSLQLGRPSNQTSLLQAAGLIDQTSHLADFAETAALVAELDLIISVDTAVAHLAGAMAKPVWTLLPFVPDWRWGLEAETTPWYPTMRLFRQSKPGDWNAVLQRAACALSHAMSPCDLT